MKSNHEYDESSKFSKQNIRIFQYFKNSSKILDPRFFCNFVKDSQNFVNFWSIAKCPYTSRIGVILAPFESLDSVLSIGAILALWRSIKVYGHLKISIFFGAVKKIVFSSFFSSTQICPIFWKILENTNMRILDSSYS